MSNVKVSLSKDQTNSPLLQRYRIHHDERSVEIFTQNPLMTVRVPTSYINYI